MSRQLLFTAAACALAACVLIATLVFSPSVSTPEKTERPILDPNAKFQAGPDPSKSTVVTPQTITPSGVVERYHVRRYNEARKQLTILSGEKARPKPNGIVDIEKIIAHIHLIPGRRVVEIKAPRGSLIAPDNIPESGTLAGGVIITLYESPENKLVDLAPDSPDASLRLFLDDEVKFDLELGTVESAGIVHLTTSRVDFQGTGLSLIYNERRRRINRLEIAQGKTMRFNPKAGRELKADGGTKEDKNRSLIADYYKATLDTQVRIDAQQAKVQSKKMEILFSLENRSEREEPVKEISQLMPSYSPRFGGGGWPTSTRSSITTQSATIGANSARSMMKPSPEDVVIQWAGALLMEPLDETPAELAGPDDTMITLIDEVQIESARKETISAQRVEYLSSAARVRIFGDTLTPATIQAPELGRLQVIDFVIHQNEGTGRITGPGAINANASAIAAPAGQAAQGKLPQGLLLQWNEGADFSFHVVKPAAAEAGDAKADAPKAKKNTNPTLNPVARLDALKDAVFHGVVKVEHPQFDLLTDRLAIAMAQPVQGRQDPQEIIAKGSVHATARGSRDQPPLDLDTDELTIRFTSDGKSKAQPTQLLATGGVKTQQGERGLSAKTLDVALAPAKPAATGDRPTDRLAIERLLAQTEVEITAQSPRMVVKADKLDGNAVTGILHLYGTQEKPAVVERESNTLTGKHITLRESDQYVTVDGPGQVTFIAASEPAKAGALPPPPQRLKVNWLHSMDFNNTTGHANFRGQVVSDSDRGVDVTRFQSAELALEIDPLNPAEIKGKKQGLQGLIEDDAKAKSPAVEAPKKDPVKAKQPDRQIRKMVAKDKVVFEAEQWADRVGGKLGTRFRLTGPLLDFDNTTGKLTVTGAGTMQIEDYRAKDKAKEKPADAKAASPVAFVGQGVTLFLWQSSLVIDANHNDVRIDKEVKMIQQPATGSEIIMQCNQLIADFQSTGGLSSWLTGKAGQPKLDNVTAAGNLVILYQKQTVRGDQLYYTSNKQMAIISAEDGRMAELDTETTTLPARQFRWFLDKDRIVAEEPGAVRTKVGGN